MYNSFKHCFILFRFFFLNEYLQDTFIGLKFHGAPTSILEGDDYLSYDTSNKHMCKYTSSEDED